MMAGGIDIVPCSLPEARALIEAKKVKALAVMADHRAELFPEVPTLKELGINWAIGAWWGITVPKGTPGDIVAALGKSIEKIVVDSQFKEFMKKNGFTISYKNAADFEKFLIEDDGSKGKLMKEIGLAK